MHLLRGSASLSVLTLLFACAATQVLAQGPSTSTECPECDALVRQVAQDKAEVKRREEALKTARESAGFTKEQIEQRLESLIAKQHTLEADEQELRNCRLRCQMREGLPPLPPEIRFVSHPVPIAKCKACEYRAFAAKEALYRLLDDEFSYFRLRSEALAARTWLTSHNDQTGSPEFLEHFGTLVERLEGLATVEKYLPNALANYELAMKKLARCNASECKESFTVQPGVQPIFVPKDEGPKAACADCEGDALDLKKQLALLQRWQAKLAVDLALNERLLDEAKRAGRDPPADSLQRRYEALQYDSARIAEAEKLVEDARAALDSCNKKCDTKTTGKADLPGSTLVPPIPGGGTQPPAGGGTVPGPGAASGTGTPTITPPAGTRPPVGPVETRPTPPVIAPPAIPPPPDAVPVSTGAFAAAPVIRPFSFSLSGDAGLVTDRAPFIGVLPLTDSGLLRGSRRMDTASWHLGFDPPGWLWDLGGMDGHRTTSAQVPVGTESGWVYHVAAPNGSTGVSSAGGANASLRTKYEDQHLNLTLPSAVLKADGDLKVLGEPSVGLRHAKITYSGMISNLSAPSISSATDQRVKEYDLRAGYGIHVERTFANRIVGSLGVDAEAIYYHSKYNGTQNNVCPVCSAATQIFNVSTSNDRNRLSLGLSSTAGLSYPVSESASIFLMGMYRYEAGAPTLVNKITPTDPAPHLDKGGREFASGQLGFEIRF